MSFNILRERLEGLMLFRVVLVTFFLGGGLLVDVEALHDFSDVRNATIVTLIVGAYALTIFYAILLRYLDEYAPLAVVQLTLDIILVLVLVDVSGGITSPFLFLFLLIVINSAVVMGRRAALNTAGAVTGALLVTAAQSGGLFDAIPASGYVWKDAFFRVGLNATAAFIIAVLAGYLTERLGEATTQLAEQQSSIRELKALNENILASLSSGLVTVDADHTVIFVNRAAAEILGLERNVVLGERLSEVLPDIAPRLVAATESSGRAEGTHVRPDGTDVYLGYSTSPLRNADDAEVGSIVIFQDLSDVKLLEEQMRRAERLAAIGRLAAAIAHEIRNPLASISGSVEMLSTEHPADDEILRKIILREVDRLDHLISEFLEYTRQRPLQRVACDPVTVVAEVLKLFENREGVSEWMELRFEHVDEGQLSLDLDVEAFQQVLWNLLNNAAEASEDVDSPRIRVSVLEEGDSVIVAVDDNGPGIATEHIDDIFQPFFTTKANGTGLGLATIYRIVEDHGATIDVEPHGELGGARFAIEF